MSELKLGSPVIMESPPIVKTNGAVDTEVLLLIIKNLASFPVSDRTRIILSVCTFFEVHTP